ncbi:2-oxoglutarate and iron-dependent oxygenase domain-containing protein CP2-like isoform X1 [Argentina anserina]|uniref:2-oxoglutarate and iron-dependent oxygenase domain-containing protein CP2-like isoform X1 n=1 Tax=Argentina anserina TaxID=57926 RepID=UPI0021763DC5|nr:2-oxoglutarate and iron-dependent oxygenase domain-containing protein CP2-like isoform X1 [Potentilla anserina]
MDGSVDGSKPPPQTANGNGVVSKTKLRLKPEKEHKSESYHDLQQLEFSPLLFSSLEHYLPPNMLNVPRELKLRYMRDILLRYTTEGERARIQRHREYRERITSNYQSLHEELYTMQAEEFFVPSFLNAIKEGTEDSLRSVMTEPSPGIFTFEMFQPHFCELLVSEVENFERWVHKTKFEIMRPNTMNKFGAVLDDFGFESMLDKLVEEFIRPMSRVLFPEVGGATLDSHHGFVVEYGMDRDVELGFHVDDSEVTLNLCLGKQFIGGELYFRGVRCDKHVNSETLSEDVQFFIVVATDMVLEVQYVGNGPTYYYGAEVLSLESLRNIRKIVLAGADTAIERRKNDSVNQLLLPNWNYLTKMDFRAVRHATFACEVVNLQNLIFCLNM